MHYIGCEILFTTPSSALDVQWGAIWDQASMCMISSCKTQYFTKLKPLINTKPIIYSQYVLVLVSY